MSVKSSFILLICFLFLLSGCHTFQREEYRNLRADKYILVLGIMQDAGYPQIGCVKACCRAYLSGKEEKKHVTSLALLDRKAGKYWLLEATTDISAQLQAVNEHLGADTFQLPKGIFITHAHIGHYSGLMQLGKEAMAVRKMPVFAMPRLDTFLRNNGPWSQLVKTGNIDITRLRSDSTIDLDGSFRITPITVPHRDEYSETVGFLIRGDSHGLIFIPDIDKWDKWDREMPMISGKADLALLDGTFFRDGELAGRDMSQVPHPFITESMDQFGKLPDPMKAGIRFIHFNHTNPVIRHKSVEKDAVIARGFGVAEEGMVIEL
jgi:pyrroloquinoline quinone biosynthesis protein B